MNLSKHFLRSAGQVWPGQQSLSVVHARSLNTQQDTSVSLIGLHPKCSPHSSFDEHALGRSGWAPETSLHWSLATMGGLVQLSQPTKNTESTAKAIKPFEDDRDMRVTLHRTKPSG